MTKKQERILLNTLTALLCLLAIVGILVISTWIVIKTTDAGPTNTAQAYVSTVKNAAGEQKYFMELEYWENADGNGKEVFEFTFNGYTDYINNTVLGKGVQFVDNITPPKTPNNKGVTGLASRVFSTSTLNILWDKMAYDFDERTGVSWGSIDDVDFGDKLYVNIGEDMYMVSMEGTYNVVEQSFNLGKSIINGLRCLFTDWNGFNHNENFYNSNTYTYNYRMIDFYAEVLNAMQNTSAGYGSTICNLVDLGKYFNIYKLNDNNNPELVTDARINNVYFAIKVTKHYEGLRRASESNFKQVLGDADYSTVDSDNYFNDYSSTAVLPTLTARDFDYYGLNTGGYIAMLKQSVIEDLKSTNIDEVVVDINVNDNYFAGNTQFVGITASSFGGFKLKELRITLNQTAPQLLFTFYEAGGFEAKTGLEISKVKLSSVGRYAQNIRTSTNDYPFHMSEEVGA